MARNPFSRTGSQPPFRSGFDLSHEHTFSTDFGLLYPVYTEDCMPGDIFKLDFATIIRFMPMVAPLLHEVNARIHVFFVPYRILDDTFEEMFTGGKDGKFTVAEGAPAVPIWKPALADTANGKLWDAFGFQTGVVPDESCLPADYIRRAYNLIWNEYYRDENLQDELDIEDTTNCVLLRACWEKDYFTSTLPFQQRGSAPALPLSGLLGVEFTGTFSAAGGTTPSIAAGVAGSGVPLSVSSIGVAANLNANMAAFLDQNSVDLEDALTFNMSDLRYVMQLQKFMERNARGGYRFTEHLRNIYGVAPSDARLQRPEYVGGTKFPIVVSEVLQTSGADDDTASKPSGGVGKLAGHGIAVDKNFIAKYRVEEPGCLMALMSVMPRAVYQQGIDRQFIKHSALDFMVPQFVHLSERPVLRGELLVDGSAADGSTFGYQGMYSEYRFRKNLVTGNVRDLYDYWTMSRIFDPSSPPVLNDEFVQCNPRKDVFAVQTEDPMRITVGINCHGFRPIPLESNPGFIDHM